MRRFSMWGLLRVSDSTMMRRLMAMGGSFFNTMELAKWTQLVRAFSNRVAMVLGTGQWTASVAGKIGGEVFSLDGFGIGGVEW
jgi:hypothetical protein